jgi:hypothetical protein
MLKDAVQKCMLYSLIPKPSDIVCIPSRPILCAKLQNGSFCGFAYVHTFGVGQLGKKLLIVWVIVFGQFQAECPCLNSPATRFLGFFAPFRDLH